MRFLADFLRRLSLLCLLFIVLGGPSVVDSGRALNVTDTNAKCQFRSAGAAGPIYACKDPRTGKVFGIECKVPPGVKMPKQVSGAELQNGHGRMYYVQDGRNDGKFT